MAISIIHLPTNIDLSSKEILLHHNMFYVGKAISNLSQSLLYKELPEKAYKSWLWTELKNKSDVYQAIVDIKEVLISKVNITLVCSCQQSVNCPATIIRKAISYLVKQDKLSQSQKLAFDDFIQQLSIDEDNYHDFCLWLGNNSLCDNNLPYPYTWLCYISTNLQST